MKRRTAKVKLREHQDVLNEFERLFQIAQQEAVEAEEERASYHGHSRDERTWLVGRAEFTRAEVDRIMDNRKYYLLTKGGLL